MGKNRILVALDGSQRALKTIEYLCVFKPFLKKELVRQNIITPVPDCYDDLGEEPFRDRPDARAQAWASGHRGIGASGHRAEMDAFMEKSKTLLIGSGFKPEAVHIRITQREKEGARDLMDEAQKGYEALVIRRRGKSNVSEFDMGRIPWKVMHGATEMTVWLVP